MMVFYIRYTYLIEGPKIKYNHPYTQEIYCTHNKKIWLSILCSFVIIGKLSILNDYKKDDICKITWNGQKMADFISFNTLSLCKVQRKLTF